MSRIVLLIGLFMSLPGWAQHEHGSAPKPEPPQHEHGTAPKPEPPQHQHGAASGPSMISTIVSHSSDGTGLEPNSVNTPMWMKSSGGWMWMLHGTAYLNAVQQSSARGGDKIFSTNWLMPMAQRQFGNGTLTLRGMFSLEPGTIPGRYYPLLFQTGETANGRPIVDGQHPHDFFMEIAAIYDYRIGTRNLLSLYFAPIGSPAMGPVAYPHRTSTIENPLAALGHHQQDSTHIASDVVTLGFTHRSVRVEISGFHGREPDEERWNIDQGALDSWSTRLTINPATNWSGQFSYASLHSPEGLHPDDNARRQTASVMYHRPTAGGFWSSTVLWGRNQGGHHENVFNSYLAESTWKFAHKNHIWGRVENTDRSNELLYPRGTTPPAGFEEAPFARIQAYTFGYSRSLPSPDWLETAIGTQVSVYNVPDSLRPHYGSKPAAVLMFFRVRPGGKH
jgi:hypothetical protein